MSLEMGPPSSFKGILLTFRRRKKEVFGVFSVSFVLSVGTNNRDTDTVVLHNRGL